MRLYAHLLLTEGCEAPGCRIRTHSLHLVDGHLVRACCPAHAEEADRRLSEKENAK